MKLVLALAVALAVQPPCPFVGHNTYGDGRLEAALRSGIPGVELDVSWGRLRRAAVVTHNKLSTGFGSPELGECAKPVWPAFKAAADDRFVMIDIKSGEDNVAKRIHEVLAPHAASLSRMTPGGAYQPGKITVYLSGSNDAQKAYERHARQAGVYLAFGSHAYDKEDWRPDAADYAPAEAPGWRRYVNIDIRCFEKDKKLDPARVAAAAAACGAAGYPIRAWIVNAPAAWRVCVDGGIAMIATDDYEDAMRFWESLRR